MDWDKYLSLPPIVNILMRKLLYILLAVLLLPCCVHQPQNGVRSLLKEAERMMRTSPDTAYFLLREMGATMYLKTEADSAYHGLLLMEAQTKNGMKLTDTTRLQSLIHYYQEQQDSLMQVRLLRLRAVAYRDGGHYNEAVRCYNATIDKAKRIDEKRWLADMYQELAHLHYSGFLILGTDSCKRLSDSLYNLTIQTAKELGDSMLWMKSLIAPIVVRKQQKNMETYEQQLLQALNLAVALEDSTTGADVSMYLSVLYGEKGIKEKVLSYVKRSLSLRGKKSSEAVFCIALGNAFQQIGMQDSVDYYFRQGKELQNKEMFAEASSIVQRQSEETVKKQMSALAQRMQQHEELESQSRKKRMAYVGVGVLLVVLLGCGAFYLKKSKHYEAMEQQRKNLEKEKEELAEEYAQIQKRLTGKQQEIQLLQRRLDSLSSDAVRVLDKAKQIISAKQNEIRTDLKMEDSDWLLLLQETDNRLDGAMTRIQQEYQLSDKEVRLCCLILKDIPTSHLSYLFERSSSYPYRIIRPLFRKLGIECDSSTYKEVLQLFIAKLQNCR